MASITLSVPLPPPLVPALDVGPIVPAAPVALIVAESQAAALPSAAPELPAPAAPPATDAMPDGAAMRPDQVFMSRQMAWPATDGASLANSWRSLVRNYGAALAARDQKERSGQLPPTALLLAGQDGRPTRQQESAATPADAWRFTIHPRGPRAQHLCVITEEADQPPGRRRRPRAALRLELELEDGVRVTLQVEPLPQGLVLELCAPGARELERLRALQPQLEAAIARSNLPVLRWRYRDSLPGTAAHARVPADQAPGMFTLPVFRALAELALALPLRRDAETGA
jgi:hypothetical protein